MNPEPDRDAGPVREPSRRAVLRAARPRTTRKTPWAELPAPTRAGVIVIIVCALAILLSVTARICLILWGLG